MQNLQEEVFGKSMIKWKNNKILKIVFRYGHLFKIHDLS